MENLKYEWNQEIRVPIKMPTMNSKVLLSLMDYDVGRKDERIGGLTLNIKDIVRTDGFTPTWFNLYGPPVKNVGMEGLIPEKRRIRDKMSKVSHMATFNHGRVLISARMEKSNAPLKNGAKTKVLPKKVKIDALDTSEVPSTESYTMRAHIVQGSEICFKDKLKVELKWATASICTEEKNGVKGMYEWNKIAEESGIILPKDVSQLPDVFVYLYKGNDLICYQRLPAADVLAGKYGNMKGDYGKGVHWVQLLEEPLLDKLKDTETPGNILMQLEIVTRAEAAKHKFRFSDELSSKEKKTVRVYLYQARNLAAADSNGSSDPYATIQIGENKKKGGRREATLNPSYYEVISFDNIMLPRHLSYAPQVIVNLYDWDMWSSADMLGNFRIDLSDPDVVVDRPKGEPIREVFIGFVFVLQITPITHTVALFQESKQCFRVKV